MPRPRSDERSIGQSRAEPSTEMSSAKPLVECLGTVPLRPLGDSLNELSSTELIVEPTGFKPSIELPRPQSEEPSTEQSNAELSAELSSDDPLVKPIGAKLSTKLLRQLSHEPGAEPSSAKPSAELSGPDLIFEPSGTEPNIEPLRLLSDEPSFEPSTAKPSIKLLSEDPIIEPSCPELSIPEQSNPFVEQSRAEPSIEPPMPLSNELIFEQ